MGKKVIVAVAILSVLLFVSCASTKDTVVEREPQAFAIHDVVFMDDYPDNYDSVVPVKHNNFFIGETKILVIRFGGLVVEENNVVNWAVIIEVFLNGSYTTVLGPEYFSRNLNDGTMERDKYIVVLPLEMYETLNLGEYLFNIYVIDASTYESVVDTIEFTVSQNM